MQYIRPDGRSKRIPFPPGSHGFLYWHLEPDAPPVSGEVRFRTTISSDPATFPSGRDLQLPDGRTWSMSVLGIARRSQYSGLRAHLLSEELVTARMLDTAANNLTPYKDHHRIPKSDIPATSKTGARRRSALLLRTLNQTRLNAEDFVDLTGRVSKDVHFPLVPAKARLIIHYAYSAHGNPPFPPDCHGFLYWNIDPDGPPVTGQVRFRTTTSSDPATFSSGCDLHLPDGRTWNISLFRIARVSQYSGLRAHLLSEGLVTAKVLDTALNASASYQGKHGIPQSDIPATTAAGLRRNSVVLLRTLNQTRLDAEDFVNLSGRVRKPVRFPFAREEPSFQMRYFWSGHRDIPFPSDSQGFFYWHLHRDGPPITGQVRFRITTSSDPATFPSGRDLQLPNGRTWHISLFDIARRSQYSGLRAHLLSEKVVTKNVLDTAMNVSARNGTAIAHPVTGSLLIWKFGQRFLVEFPSICVSLWLLGTSVAERVRLPALFSVLVRESESTAICYVLSQSSDLRDSPETGKDDFLKIVDCTPFSGRALVQFERSTLPEHKGTRTVVFRIIKVMPTSDGCDDAYWTPESQEDGFDMTGIHQHAWSVNVDQPPRRGLLSSSAKALSILFDNEALQERRAHPRVKS
ncbi:hypothetical protein OE88DRAFT_1221970 [Heliocybe sulcata]|uniref:Uncharacterized protein n=1 Tax=Heliocybe sulcata TaxID=5364 RepID=A0A5C3MKU2_9AGAM|nr:hypothetical protein OE88DRAFT_1221970 [Heliocybe sulcata]